MKNPRLFPAIVLTVLAAYSIFLWIQLPQPYGRIALVVVLVGFAFNLISNRKRALTLISLTVAGSVFVLTAGTMFMVENQSKRKLFDIETAVTFHKISFEEAKAKAKAENKVLFVDFYTAWCVPCLEFTRNVLTDKEVGEAMNKSFISLKYDAEKGDGIALAARYKVAGYPTLLVIDTDGNVLEEVGGQFIPRRELMIETARKYQKN
ncbi:MAG TPA: thioredoxin family protein [Cyclobacteriaceae bacterium]|nr:thioredoxin family protein [Cyclobacteriaceae bacterium]HMV91741.1 thioredoxin family protein [Cyclobacteriaceae bacterium]HMX01501.1 thioredoxin family protein [Cyclobacteriaceae bacterium]HMX51497.1 thioredoxin family protein [Cyclobacteriaceae bacterium]HMY92297.1 thioredoxin family protein [Cyclobacteriaceae bacterium]